MARAEGRLRAGVVGAGHMGQYHMLVYAELWDMELVGVVDVDRDRAARVAAHYDTRAFADHRALIGRVDLVSVAVPTEHHFQVASDFLEAGVSVLVEKPITPTLEEAHELFAVARRTGAVLHVGHVERFNGAVQELKKIVERPLLVEPRRLGPFEPRVQKDTVVMDLMIHDLDIVLGLIDSPPRRMTAMGSTVHSGSVDVANVQIWFESGTIAVITASRATEEKIRTLAVTQPDAYIVLDYAEQDIRVHRRAAQEYTLNRESIRYRRASFVEHVQVHKDNPLKLEILHLARAVKRARAGESALLAERVAAVLLAGKFWAQDVLGARRADATFVGMAARAGALTEVRMLDVIVTKLAEVDIALLDQRGFLGDGLATAGCWSSRQPTAEERREVERGLSLARQAAEARIGQTVVLRRGAGTAVEALEGTTQAIRPGAAH